jgi:hypothetical protein
MKFILLIIGPVAVAILVGFTTSSWIWAVISFILSMFIFNWIAVALFGRPTAEQNQRWEAGQFEDFSPSEIGREIKQVKSRLLGPTSELLNRVIVIADFKNSLPFVIRAVVRVNGVYVQGNKTKDGFTEYAAGGDTLVPDLVFFTKHPKELRVFKYAPGEWEKALNRTYFKVQRLKAALEARDKESFLASFQEGLLIADEDAFRVQVEAGFTEMMRD